MEFGVLSLAVPHDVSLLNTLECLGDISEKGRSSFMPRRDAGEEELLCPKPLRIGGGMHATSSDVCGNSVKSLRGMTSLSAVGEAGREILEILYEKANSDSACGRASPVKLFNGSPPCRAINPVIHDTYFIQKLNKPSMAIPHKSSGYSLTKGGSGSSKSSTSATSSFCSSSYGSEPFVRIEGFVSGSPDSNHSVPAYA